MKINSHHQYVLGIIKNEMETHKKLKQNDDWSSIALFLENHLEELIKNGWGLKKFSLLKEELVRKAVLIKEKICNDPGFYFFITPLP